MTTVNLKSLTHRGTVSAAGLLFAANLSDEASMRRRVLACRRDGARVFRVGDDVLLLFAESFRLDCRRAPALPIVRDGDVLTSAPLRKSESQRLARHGETLALLVAGELKTFLLSDLATEDPSDWIDLDGFTLVETTTLGETVGAPRVVKAIENVDLRKRLTDVPAADAGLAEFVAKLNELKSGSKESKVSKLAALAGASVSAVGGGMSKVASFLQRLGIAGAGQSPGSITGRVAAPKAPSNGFLRRFLTKAALRLGVASLIGGKQAKYLLRMMEMFENGDIDDALKHAIPLSGLESLGDKAGGFPFLGFLRPRTSLRIGQTTVGGSSVFLSDGWFGDLRSLYRRTFDRLVAQNRIDEAAFVLAELLNSHAEAVEFLEKHGRFRLAAELAESRGLPKETQTRQWMLAGETEKAMRLAVLHDCFEYVVLRLESRKNPEGATFRELWAQNLALKGNYAAAVDTIWPLATERAQAIEWIDKAIEFGGPRAGAMLVKRILLMPSELDELRTAVLELARRDDDHTAEERAAFAREALRLKPNDELRLLVRPIIRRLAADNATDPRLISAGEIAALVELSRDRALRTDFPKLIGPYDAPVATSFRIEIAAHDAGAAKIYDAVPLPGGKIALALGESGVKIVSKEGKTLVYFDQPTFRFIVADSGSSAICIAPRGASNRLAKIDFVNRRARYWCDAKFTECAGDFDGRVWFVGLHDEELDINDVHAIDTEAVDFLSLWKIPDIEGRVVSITRGEKQLELLVRLAEEDQKWRYELPSMTLRAKDSVAREIETIIEDKDGHDISVYGSGFEFVKTIPILEFPDETAVIVPESVVGDVRALKMLGDAWVLFRVYRVNGELIAEIFLEENAGADVKLDSRHAIVTDHRGRVIIFDHKERVLRANLRC